jgi:hypothetical protein
MARDYNEYREAIIKGREKELDRLKGPYLQAKAETEGMDPTPILKLSELVRSYQPGEAPEKAVYLLAQAAMVVSEMAAPFVRVREYERKEREYLNLREQLGPICDTEAQ